MVQRRVREGGGARGPQQQRSRLKLRGLGARTEGATRGAKGMGEVSRKHVHSEKRRAQRWSESTDP